MMKAFIDEIPYEIEESAILDGLCSTIGLNRQIVLRWRCPV